MTDRPTVPPHPAPPAAPPQPEHEEDNTAPGRAARDPAEGPAPGGGSALDHDDPAADAEIGGGD